MNKPKPRLIEMTIEIPADRETVWKALTEGPGIANWFPQFCEADPGVGGRVHLSWGPECEWDTFITDWQPLTYLRWQDDQNDQSENPYAVEFHLEAAGESTRVRLVQSGFSHGDEFEEMYQGVKAGWTYFLYNLQHYMRYHLGKNREMLKENAKFLGTRAQIWQRLLLASGGLVLNPPLDIDLGLELQLNFGAGSSVCGIVDVLVPERTSASGCRTRTTRCFLSRLNRALNILPVASGFPLMANRHRRRWLRKFTIPWNGWPNRLRVDLPAGEPGHRRPRVPDRT